ncbi:MAG: hypothetical protein AAF125_28190, partial [Chloroflexota bacterium]
MTDKLDVNALQNRGRRNRRLNLVFTSFLIGFVVFCNTISATVVGRLEQQTQETQSVEEAELETNEPQAQVENSGIVENDITYPWDVVGDIFIQTLGYLLFFKFVSGTFYFLNRLRDKRPTLQDYLPKLSIHRRSGVVNNLVLPF